jgi:RNA polymerase sigma-70 factor (sigma-E family)
MESVDAAEFDRFVAGRYASLVRSAFLLIGDRGEAEDLVQSALYRTFRSWHRLTAAEAAEAYTRTTMLRLALRWRRRRWRGEIPTDQVPEEAGRAGGSVSGVDAVDVGRALDSLPIQQRAVLVLRYFDDLSEAQTAAALGCSVGTVKSRASRAIAALRAGQRLDPPGASDTTEARHG